MFGARVSFAGRRRWSTKDELADLLCDEGADVIDYALTTGTEALAAWFGSSKSIEELQDQNYFCLTPNTWPAPDSISGRAEPALQRFLADDVWFREDVVDRFFASGAESFFEWEGRKGCSVMEKRLEAVECGEMNGVDRPKAVERAELDRSPERALVDRHDDHRVDIGPSCRGELRRRDRIGRDSVQRHQQFGASEIRDRPGVGGRHRLIDDGRVRSACVALHQRAGIERENHRPPRRRGGSPRRSAST